MVGIYAPKQATQRIALWGSLLQTLSVGHPGLLMGDFNMCVEASQSTSEHSIMDNPEQLAWDSLAMEVLDKGRKPLHRTSSDLMCITSDLCAI